MLKLKLRSKPLFGARVSHSNKKTKRKFKPNAVKTKLWSLVLNRFVSVKARARFVREVRKYGGVDFYAVNCKRMPKPLLKLKLQMLAVALGG